MMIFVPPEKALAVNRALTGKLGTWERVEPVDPIQALRPPAPPWSRIRPADIARLERARAAAATTSQ